ncbi:metallophosphoesterase family protein [Rhodalgimonas zhirmunskyi]|uniref:Metallophosphoesterase family protein n=1 Tax=Rhodalgimonas zhirmunskyi TaxID=2964767 RepID=A0AAJ1U6B5_9RHOB|nr:metallophosphoesterase family protein [Rhodoalgimonas zhirmunskyi]MDQ2093824.1 metallophosphoesterase family protein [Rhodoalgimonas zhirmunskyi]
MKIMAFSDLHLARSRAAELVAASAGADLVVGAGDFCNHREGLSDAMEMLSGIDAPFVMVPGNAESADELRAAVAETGRAHWHVLHGEGASIAGLSIFGLGYGIPLTPFGAWSCDMPEDAAETALAACEGADLLITHSPPKGVGDLTSQGASVGSTAIAAAISRIAPRLALCGHIHDSWGARGQIGPTEVANLGPTPNWFEIERQTT